MLYTDTTKAALKICYEAHAGQVDKSGLPYVFHPFHLAERMKTEHEVCAALLHDVMEDTETTAVDLVAAGIPEKYVDTCLLLKHEAGMPYMEYVARLADDRVARKVKMADLKHNSDLTRLEGDPAEEDLQRVEKYRTALDLLEGKQREELLPLFLYTMQDYERIAAHVVVSEGLRVFDFTSATATDALVSYGTDSVAIDIRLMLQRKYFQRNERLHWKELLKAAQDAGVFNGRALADISERMESVHSRPIELILYDGSTISEQFGNAEDVIYGFLLHGDADRVTRSLMYPSEMRLLSLAPYVLAREELLFHLRDLCVEAGVKPMGNNVAERAAVLRRERHSKSGLGIKGSPFWSNVIGKDADEMDLEVVAKNNSLDDNIVLLIAWEFLSLLCKDSLDRQALRKLIWKRNWVAWGDFELAAKVVRSIENPGVSASVMHQGGSCFAQVKVLPNVIEPWVTDVPQLVSDVACVICLTKRRGAWKVNGIALLKSPK